MEEKHKVVGKRNTDFLGKIVRNLLTFYRGEYQEDPEIRVLKKKSRFCQYDFCKNKRGETDRVVKISYDRGPVAYQSYVFHSECLDHLLIDERFIP